MRIAAATASAAASIARSEAPAWIHERFGRDAPLLFDRRYAPKPAYFGVREALAVAQKAQSMPSVQPENDSDQK